MQKFGSFLSQLVRIKQGAVQDQVGRVFVNGSISDIGRPGSEGGRGPVGGWGFGGWGQGSFEQETVIKAVFIRFEKRSKNRSGYLVEALGSRPLLMLVARLLEVSRDVNRFTGRVFER